MGLGDKPADFKSVYFWVLKLVFGACVHVPVDHVTRFIVDANHSVVRPAVEFCELNRVGDPVWPGIP